MTVVWALLAAFLSADDHEILGCQPIVQRMLGSLQAAGYALPEIRAVVFKLGKRLKQRGRAQSTASSG